MAPRRFDRSSKFNSVDANYEEELIVAYDNVLGDEEDLHLKQMPEFFSHLGIPSCYTKDIEDCIDYYYDSLYEKDIKFDVENGRHVIEIQFLRNFTLFSSFELDSLILFGEIIDIVDIDKLLKRCCKLLIFRDHHRLIKESWSLFVNKKNIKTLDQLLLCKLTLPDLQKLKTDLGVQDEMSDSLLIDMMSCCSTVDDEIVNYDFSKLKRGKFIAIRDFAEILGQLGELD